VSFFPPDPDVPEPQEDQSPTPAWWAAPEDEIPVIVPIAEVLASLEHLAIAVVGAFVYRDGVELRIERRLRRQGLPPAEWGELCQVFMDHPTHGGRQARPGRLRFGVILSDGSRVFDSSQFFPGHDPRIPPDRHTLTRRHGGGSGGSSNYTASDSLWLWPRPDPAALELVIEWPELGVPERRTALNLTDADLPPTRSRSFWQ
jgi:hypothetical protein